MAFKFVLLAAVFVAQGFASKPLGAFRGRDICKNPALEIPFEFEEAMHEMDEVRETISMAAMDAYVQNINLEVVIACFEEQKENYMRLGERISEMVRDASQELTEILGDKAEKYARIMAVPLRNIAVTMRALPEIVYNFIKNKEFIKAVEAMKEARKIVEDNSRILGEAMQHMAAEIPELTERVEEIAREIRNEARKGSEAISQAIRKCIEEGGPK